MKRERVVEARTSGSKACPLVSIFVQRIKTPSDLKSLESHESIQTHVQIT